MKNYLIFIVLSFIFNQSNHIYLELFGPGLQGSINYEKSINEKLFFRSGLGIPLKVSEYNQFGTSEIKITPIVVGLNHLRGNKFKFDISTGISFWMIDFQGSLAQDIGGLEFDSDGNYPLLYTTIGFRYQNIERRFTFKGGISATNIKVEETSGIIPSIYIGSGYIF